MTEVYCNNDSKLNTTTPFFSNIQSCEVHFNQPDFWLEGKNRINSISDERNLN